MTLDPLVLSRLQFVWVVAWHVLLPAFTIGLASYIAVFEGLHLITGKGIYLRLSKYWLRIFAVSFGLGVVTGIIMPFQLGTNWSRFSDAVGDVVSPLLGYEGLTAFFLEASFLGILLFGRKLVPSWAHFFAALMVAAGTLFSAFWILAVNSWMQTPSGFIRLDGRFLPQSWTDIVFSPSFPYRLAHTVVAFYITTAFIVLGVGAYTVRRRRFPAESRLMVWMALGLLSVLVPLQMLIGDEHGRNTLAHQPAKLAAIEAIWETGSRLPLALFALPDQSAALNHAQIAIPILGSLILTHDPNGSVRGLKEWPADERPPVAIVFFAFRIMVGLGVIMLAMIVAGWWLAWRRRLFDCQWYLRACMLASPIGFFAVLAGWTVTEVGRQPWTVYGLMRTADSLTPSLTGSDVVISLSLYVLVYLLVYPTAIVFMMRKIRQGPDDGDASEAPVESGMSARPVQSLPPSA